MCECTIENREYNNNNTIFYTHIRGDECIFILPSATEPKLMASDSDSDRGHFELLLLRDNLLTNSINNDADDGQ